MASRRGSRDEPARVGDARSDYTVFVFLYVAAVIALFTLPIFPAIALVALLFSVSFGTVHLFNRWRVRRSGERASRRRDEDERERRALAARGVAVEGEDETTAAQTHHPRRRRRRRG